MSRLSRVCVVSLAALGLLLPACDRFSGGDKKKEKKEKKEKKQEEKEEAEAEADTGSKQAKKEGDTGGYSQEDFIKASADLACVDTELTDDDIEDMEKVKTDILGKYGFDNETFKAAEKKWSDTEKVKGAIDERLSDCSKADAKKLAGLVEEKKKPEPDPKPRSTGAFNAQIGSEAGFDRGELQLNISSEFKAYGYFKGKREGKGFRIPFDGTVSKDNQIDASGSEGKNSVDVSGRVLDNGASVKLSGKIWDRTFTVTMDAN